MYLIPIAFTIPVKSLVVGRKIHKIKFNLAIIPMNEKKLDVVIKDNLRRSIREVTDSYNVIFATKCICLREP